MVRTLFVAPHARERPGSAGQWVGYRYQQPVNERTSAMYIGLGTLILIIILLILIF